MGFNSVLLSSPSKKEIKMQGPTSTWHKRKLLPKGKEGLKNRLSSWQMQERLKPVNSSVEPSM